MKRPTIYELEGAINFRMMQKITVIDAETEKELWKGQFYDTGFFKYEDMKAVAFEAFGDGDEEPWTIKIYIDLE